MAMEISRPLLFFRVPRQDREYQVPERGVLSDEVPSTGAVSMLQQEQQRDLCIKTQNIYSRSRI